MLIVSGAVAADGERGLVWIGENVIRPSFTFDCRMVGRMNGGVLQFLPESRVWSNG